MRPGIQFLDQSTADQIIREGFALLEDPGILVENRAALDLLEAADARVNRTTQIVRIPEELARQALQTCPSTFQLFDLHGNPAVHYGGSAVHFDPGSAALEVLDSRTQRRRTPVTEDLIRLVKLVEGLPQLDAQSTAMVSGDVPEEIGDLYRLYLALNYMSKPIVTGAFRVDTWAVMLDLLTTAAGGLKQLQQKPLAVFDVCPSPPLKWSDLTCQNLIDCARHLVPAELVSMPLTGATAPVTLAGAVVQHTAECLSGVTISQLARPGAPIVWGGSPSAFDMRQGTTPMGAVGTWMIDCAYAEIGQALDLPTHAYLGMSDAKVVDAQAGLESAGGALLGALAGINMISGAGMLAFENCQSLEKLVLDAEFIGMVKHLIQGIQIRDQPIAQELIAEVGHGSGFITHDHTYRWFREELYLPSDLIDRHPPEIWEEKGSLTALDRAQNRVEDLVSSWESSPLTEELRKELREITAAAAASFGMDRLPELPN